MFVYTCVCVCVCVCVRATIWRYYTQILATQTSSLLWHPANIFRYTHVVSPHTDAWPVEFYVEHK